MKLFIQNNTNFNLNEYYKNLFEKAILKTIEYENFTKNVEISLSIVYNNEIKDLNLKFRNINKETDVLSFPLIENISQIKKSINQNVHLGDIIISIEKAINQASDFNHSLERELTFLIVHSMLHLLGYDHMNEKDEKIMFAKQNEILSELNILR